MKNIIRKMIPYKFRNAYLQYLQKRKVNIYKSCPTKLSVAAKKVSVVVPNYNYEDYIEERIDSIMKQTYPIYELIILDDCSTDNSVAKIKEIIKRYENNVKISFIENEKNGGSVFSQWQKGFSISKGDYVWIAEADDSCSPYFLENVMQGFDNDKVVISYAESKRIDEENHILRDSCRDWLDCISNNRWNKSYIHDGTVEIKEALSICNTIPNVSAVVFKKLNQVKLIEEAKQFKISGDWYIYYQLLTTGAIAYCSKSLNYFRKHSKSTSTVAKKEVELDEVLTIQKMIRDKYSLTTEQMVRQSYRYGGLIHEVDSKFLEKVSDKMAKKMAWIIPHPIKGSGGIRTMIQNANFFASKGFECDIYVEEDYLHDSNSMKKKIVKYYGECLCNVYVGIHLKKEYDILVATYSILTADYVYYMKNVKHKMYFIQDFEPWFEPVGGLYLEMERTYKYGLQGVSIGKWLTNKLSTEFDTPMTYFPFCADLNVYKKIKVEKENAICFIFQPEKARRCSNIGLKALSLVKKLRPDVKIYLYGSDEDFDIGFEADNLKIIPVDKCNELYNKCTVGLCISASNPSRIPFEMMAAGLPVVDVYRENNLYDIPDTGVLLADATPEALATALIKIYDDKKLQKQMSEMGSKFMKDYPLQRGYEELLASVNKILEGKVIRENNVKPIYNNKPVFPSEEVLNISEIIQPIPIKSVNTGRTIRFLVRCKRFLIRKLKGQK